MTKRAYRSPMDFQREAEGVLYPVHNLHTVYNTYTFIWWWSLFGLTVLISRRIPAPYSWVFLVASLVHTIVRVWKYFPATSEYVQNLPHMRRLADEARLNFSRNDIVPSRMRWTEIMFGIGRPSRKIPRHVRDYDADWCLSHRELLMQYILSLPLEVQARQRQRRAAIRNQRRQQEAIAVRHITTAPVAPALLAAARSILPHRERRPPVHRPTVTKPRPEPRTAPRSLIDTLPALPNNATPVLRRLADVSNLLDLSDLVPESVDHEHARAIIIWGCLHPGQRGRTMVQARYITEQNVREDVRNKLRHRYNPNSFEAALAWLRQTRIVISDHKRKRHQPVIALNPHAAQGVGVGQIAIKRVLAAKDAITQLTTA